MNRLFRQVKVLLVLMLLVGFQSVLAEVSLPKIFGSGMVIQREQPIRIWGWANPKEKVTVTFGGQKSTIKADKMGMWSVSMDAMPAGGPFSLLVKGTNEIRLSDVWVGDVWLCSGQSNMEWKTGQTPYKETDTSFINNAKVRLFTVQIGTDYLPRQDIEGGSWKLLSEEAISQFSAVSYHFGKFLHQELNVPIGLINSSLGATAIETWMSNETLADFPQFQPEVAPILKANKSVAQINKEFEDLKSDWYDSYYWKGIGIEESWFKPETDISDWKEITPGTFWEDHDATLADHDGAVWYRKEFDLSQGFSEESYPIRLNQIDDYDVVWVNGEKIGETYGRHNFRNYSIPTTSLKPKGNVLTVRVFDIAGKGGFSTNAFWGNPLLWGTWKYKKGLEIDAEKFESPNTVSISPFSSPGVMYNANIAPLTQLPIKGVTWYQGESNASRAQEYASLFPVMIADWRAKWGQPNLPFVYVQLANYQQEVEQPTAQSWPELRAAQNQALKLNNVGVAVTIDIGEANDIHPKNKRDVGIRLAYAAMDVAYNSTEYPKQPMLSEFRVEGSNIIVNTTVPVSTNNKYGYVSGFALAGADSTFYWAKAQIQNGEIIIESKKVKKPVAVRYAWSSNPGELNLYSKEGLPLAPFRTDTWPGVTDGEKFDHKAPRF